MMPTTEELSITLPAEMVRAIREKVSTGAYRTDSEVVREALRNWMEQERRLARLDAAIACAIADAEAGRVQDIDAARAELREHYAKEEGNVSA
jgi:antitoxin ParD1/3/4